MKLWQSIVLALAVQALSTWLLASHSEQWPGFALGMVMIGLLDIRIALGRR